MSATSTATTTMGRTLLLATVVAGLLVLLQLGSAGAEERREGYWLSLRPVLPEEVSSAARCGDDEILCEIDGEYPGCCPVDTYVCCPDGPYCALEEEYCP